jgi:hypothetical protein
MHSDVLTRLPARLWRRRLAVEVRKWDKLAGAITRILRPRKQEGKS